MAERKGGTYLGLLKEGDPRLDMFEPPTKAVDPRHYKMTPEEYMAQEPADHEGHMIPGSDMLWIYKKTPSEDGPPVPMSYLDGGNTYG